jgi:hypothetical protein
MHPERVTAMIVQNGDAHVDAINKDSDYMPGVESSWEQLAMKLHENVKRDLGPIRFERSQVSKI